MDRVQWWLIVVAFVLGFVLTFALTIRRVKREVPMGTSAGSGAGTEAPTARIPTGPKAPTTRIPTAGAAAAGAAASAGPPASKTGKSASEFETTKIPTVTDAPYGRGSARAGADGSGPSGWLIKGNEDAKAYHTPDSPSYEHTVADVWFRSEESARKAGFSSWHQRK